MKRILIVDDSPMIRMMIKYSFFSEFEIIDEESAISALPIIKNSNIDLFLLDLNMPEMDGISLTKEIRKIPKYSETPIIMLTVTSSSEKIEEGKKAGINAWVVKPCDVSKILDTVKSYIW